MSVLEVNELRVRYNAGSPEILKGINFEVGENDFFAIIGPSGAGKSTLIRCINRLVEPNSGKIYFKGNEITGMSNRKLRIIRRDIGMIFQEFNLIDRMSVMDNVLSGRLGYTGNLRSFFKIFPRKEIEKALNLLDRVGLSDQVDKRADELSGGQRQRVGIATSSLDPKISREIMSLIKEMATELNVPCLCNIHDVQLAMEFCNKIIGIKDGVKMFDGSTESLNKEKLDEIYLMEVL